MSKRNPVHYVPSLTNEQVNEIHQAVHDYFYLSPSSPTNWARFMTLSSAKENGTLTDKDVLELEDLEDGALHIYCLFVHKESRKATGVAFDLMEKGRSAKDATAEVVKSYKGKWFSFDS
jgi:hypothetical protein